MGETYGFECEHILDRRRTVRHADTEWRIFASRSTIGEQFRFRFLEVTTQYSEPASLLMLFSPSSLTLSRRLLWCCLLLQ
jgi:hypothetical protein